MHLTGVLLLVHTPGPLVMTFDLASSMAAHKVEPESKHCIQIMIIYIDKCKQYVYE